ncbi:MAG: hypothetical protein Q8P46_08990 [Hyphomicrobiales bacterium]|nr:hypothetical protein [Hyphomicrobiales bacterium]
MVKVWRVQGFNSSEKIFERDMPGDLSEAEISTVLQRLVCRHLSPDEIIRASLRKGDPDYIVHLERMGTGRPIEFGYDPHYTAELKEK